MNFRFWRTAPDPPAEPDPMLAIVAQQTEVMKQMLLTVQEMTAATRAQAESFSSYLSLFKVSEAPTSRTVRDKDEYTSELVRQGFPLHGTDEEQLRWVYEQSSQ